MSNSNYGSISTSETLAGGGGWAGQNLGEECLRAALGTGKGPPLILIWSLYNQIPLFSEGHWIHPYILIPQDSEAFVQKGLPSLNAR